MLASAFEAMRRVHAKHYEEIGEEHLHQRLKALFTLMVRAIQERNLGPMLAHAESIAEERFASGFDLWEGEEGSHVLDN